MAPRNQRHPGRTQEIDFVEAIIGERVDALAKEVEDMKAVVNNGLVSKVDKISVHLKFQWIVMSGMIAVGLAIGGYIIRILLKLVIDGSGM